MILGSLSNWKSGINPILGKGGRKIRMLFSLTEQYDCVCWLVHLCTSIDMIVENFSI